MGGYAFEAHQISPRQVFRSDQLSEFVNQTLHDGNPGSFEDIEANKLSLFVDLTTNCGKCETL